MDATTLERPEAEQADPQVRLDHLLRPLPEGMHPQRKAQVGRVLWQALLRTALVAGFANAGTGIGLLRLMQEKLPAKEAATLNSAHFALMGELPPRVVVAYLLAQMKVAPQAWLDGLENARACAAQGEPAAEAAKVFEVGLVANMNKTPLKMTAQESVQRLKDAGAKAALDAGYTGPMDRAVQPATYKSTRGSNRMFRERFRSDVEAVKAAAAKDNGGDFNLPVGHALFPALGNWRARYRAEMRRRENRPHATPMMIQEDINLLQGLGIDWEGPGRVREKGRVPNRYMRK